MLLHLRHDLTDVTLGAAGDIRAESHSLFIGALLDDLIEPVERAAADKEDIGGVHLYKLLMRMLASALRGDVRDRAFKQLEQRLLHALAGNVSGYGCVLALAGDLVYLIDIDNAFLGTRNVKVRRLKQLEDNVLNILADIAGLGKRRGVSYRKGHVEHLSHRLGKKGLAAAGGADEQDVALLKLNIALRGMEDTLIVIIYRNGQNYLRAFLTDNILIQIFLDLFRLRQLFESKRKPVIAGYSFGLVIFADYVHAHAHAVITDIAVVIAGYQAIDQRLRLAAKGCAAYGAV